MIAIVHLSDIHIDSARHPILKRVDKIARAVSAMSSGYSIALIVVVVSGDIAQSGSAQQYALATKFFNELAERLRSGSGGADVCYVFVPGNHDCDLAAPSDVRQAEIIETKLASLDLNGDLVRHFLAVQTHFFRFTSQYEPESLDQAQRQLCHQRIVQIGKRQLCFNCFNTAWMTQNPERPARLYFPSTAFSELQSESVPDLTFSVFHHPYNWLNPANAQEFKRYVESTSDLVFSGHEHTGDFYSKHRPDEDIVHCVEGEALWEPTDRTSAFNVLLFDLESRRYRARAYRWSDGTYFPKTLTDWADFERNHSSRKEDLTNNPAFQRTLNDLGMGFKHRQRLTDLTLKDLFVYPDLHQRLLQAQIEGQAKGNRIRSQRVFEFISNHKRVLIVGEAKSGKTSLAKTLYVDSQRSGLIPLLVNGTDLRGDEDRILSALDRAYVHQYSTESLELYKQTDGTSRLLIVDDLHRSKLSVAGQRSMLAILHRLSERIIIFVDESAFNIEEITDKDAARPFATYEQCDLPPLCPSLSKKLIRHWVALGSGQDATQEQIDKEVNERVRIVETFLPKQSLPAFPINVLALLQAYEAHTNLNTANGAYGELCESLITERLRMVSRKTADIPTKYAYLSQLAYYMFDKEQAFLSPQNLTAIKLKYLREFDIDINVEPILDELLAAQILTASDGNYSFKYPSYYYFFVARYFKDALADPGESPTVRSKMCDVANHLYYEPYVNILIFYLYFTRDVELIEHVLSNAKQIYCGYEACKLDDEVEFLNKLYMEPPKPISLGNSDIEEQRRRHSEELDESDMNSASLRADERDRQVTYADELGHLIKINIAFKTLQVLGQVLRNFPHVLKADLKTRVTHECYCLGLRVLTVILAESQANLETLREYFANLIKEHRKVETDNELTSETDTFMLRIISGCTHGIIKRISRSVGSEARGETYRNVLDLDREKTSVTLVDLSIKLEHFSAFPANEISEILKEGVPAVVAGW